MRWWTGSRRFVYTPYVSQSLRFCLCSLFFYGKTSHYSLVVPPPPLSVHTAEARNNNAHSHLGLLLLLGSLLLCATAASSSRRLLVGRARDNTHDLCVAHLEVAGAVGGGLCADLRVAAAELVPAAAVDAEEREVVGGCVEGHCCGALRGGLWERRSDGVVGGCLVGWTEVDCRETLPRCSVRLFVWHESTLWWWS